MKRVYRRKSLQVLKEDLHKEIKMGLLDDISRYKKAIEKDEELIMYYTLEATVIKQKIEDKRRMEKLSEKLAKLKFKVSCF